MPFSANLLRIQHVVVAVNKMDLVDYAEAIFDEIKEAFQCFASRLDNLVEMTFIPISALKGDNVVDKLDDHAVVSRPPPCSIIWKPSTSGPPKTTSKPASPSSG